MTVLVVITLFIFGIAAYKSMPTSDLPTVDCPVITINVNYPGADPYTMASTVASPLENQCMQIPGLQKIISNNTEGTTQIMLTFNLDRNVDLAAPDVQAAITRSTPNLPKDLPNPPTYSKTNPSDKPIFYINVHSDVLTGGELYDIANKQIGEHLSMIEGIAEVDLYGAQTAVRVQLDPFKLAKFNLGYDDVAAVLNTGTVTKPGGSLNGKFHTFSIEPQGQLFYAKDYNELIIKYVNGGPVKIKDVGNAIDSIQDDVFFSSYYNRGEFDTTKHGSVIIKVMRAAGSNTIKLSQEIRKFLDDVSPQMPGSVKVHILYDRSETINESLNDVKFTLLLTFILVVGVIFLFLGRISETTIPGIALPLSVVCTFGVMYLLGFSLDNLSLMALTLAMGFVVDDAIVDLENTVRIVEEGKPPFEAAIKSAEEITYTVFSMTFALITVFIPLVFMSGVVGRTFREFALTVIIAIVASCVVSRTVSPMMCSRILKPASAAKKKNIIMRFTDFFIGGMIKIYGVTLKWMLIHRSLSILIWVICIAGSLYFFNKIPKTFLPVGDTGKIIGAFLTPLGTSTEQMQKYQKEIDSILMRQPYIKQFFTVTGSTPGADQTQGSVVIILQPPDKRGPIDEIIKDLRVKLMKENPFPLGQLFLQPIPALKISTGGESTATGARYCYTMTGMDSDLVYKKALEFEKRMREKPGFVDIQNSVKLNMPQLTVKILRDRASTYGVTASDIETALSLAFAQGKVTQYTTELNQYWVMTELANNYRRKPVDLSNVYVKSSLTGGMVPLESMIEVKETVGPQAVPHSQQMISASISFNLLPDIPISSATADLNKIASDVLPYTITGNFEGEAQQFQETMASMKILIIVAIFLMYVILGILYESYIHPFTVLTTLPVAAFGGLGTLLLFNSELSLYAYIGMFMLLGIVAKNGIMIVDFANKIMTEEGKESFEAIHSACLIRFRPILMTGLAAIMGAVPLAIGIGADSSSRRPLGLIIVGGLLFAQLITLYVTPGIFLYMEKVQEKCLDRFEMTRSEAARKRMSEAAKQSHPVV